MKIIDTKIIWNRTGWLLHLTRTRKGLFDTITLKYPMPNGLKEVSKKIISPFGWTMHKFLQVAIDYI